MIYLQDTAILESSGLCRSLTTPGKYWTHNDSGNKPTLYGFDSMGRSLGSIGLNCTALDCEDVSSAIVRGTPWLVMGDIGDNRLIRSTFIIRVIEEKEYGAQKADTKPIVFNYPDGHHNCEAMAVNSNGEIILITKSWPSGPTSLYRVRSWFSMQPSVTVEKVMDFPASFGTVTSCDLSDDGRFLMVLAVIAGTPYAHILNAQTYIKITTVTMPKCYQPEGVCFSHDGLYAMMTSETNRTAGARTPLYQVRLP